MPEVIENTFIFILRPHLGSNICGKIKTKIFFLLQTKYGYMDNCVLWIFEKIISNATCGNSTNCFMNTLIGFFSKIFMELLLWMDKRHFLLTSSISNEWNKINEWKYSVSLFINAGSNVDKFFHKSRQNEILPLLWSSSRDTFEYKCSARVQIFG